MERHGGCDRENEYVATKWYAAELPYRPPLNSPIAIFVPAAHPLEVVAHPGNRKLGKLPGPSNAPQKRDKSALVATDFNEEQKHPVYPGYAMGSMVIPPGGSKYPESVGPNAHLFTVNYCRGCSLDAAYGKPDENEGRFDPKTATRFPLESGSKFIVPPGNSYSLKNISKTDAAKLTWVIIMGNDPGCVVQGKGGKDEEGSGGSDEEGSGDQEE